MDQIGSAGVGQLDDDYLGCTQLKWVATLELGAFILGAGGVPGVSVGTLRAQCFCVNRVRRGRSVVDVGAFLSPSQCSMVSWRALMSWSCASTVDDGVFWSAVVSCCTPCRTSSSGVTDGMVSL